jgi:hypothetical protein
MDLQQGLELLKRCIDELSTRFIVNLGSNFLFTSRHNHPQSSQETLESTHSLDSPSLAFKVRVADKDGVREVTL